MKENNKLTPLMWYHLALLVLLAVMCLVILVGYLSGIMPDVFQERMIAADMPVVLSVTILTVNALVPICCILYVLNRYGKKAAPYYKAFMLLAVIGNCLSAAANLVDKGNVLILAVKLILIVLLLVLTFGKNLGKRNTWIIFAVYAVFIVIDIALIMNAGIMPNGALFRIVLSPILLIITIALAIRGKYSDKDARGTI